MKTDDREHIIDDMARAWTSNPHFPVGFLDSAVGIRLLMQRLCEGKLPECEPDRAALAILAGRASCGCVHHAEEGIPCEHDLAMARDGAGKE